MDRTARSARSAFEIDNNIIDITMDEDDDDPTALDGFITIEDSGDEDDGPPPPPRNHEPRLAQPAWGRNKEPQWPEAYIDSCKLLSDSANSLGPTASTVKIGDTVEIRTPQSPGLVEDGDFMRVMKIIQNHRFGNIKLRGLIFKRNNKKFLQPMVPRKLNEVTMVTTIDTEDSRPYYLQSLEEIPLDKAFRKRRLKVTNAPFPKLSYREHSSFDSRRPDGKQIAKIVADNDVLVCRNFFAQVYGKGERDRARRIPYQGILRFMTPKEADEEGGILTGKPAEHVDLSKDTNEDDILMERTLSLRHGPNRQRQYTFGDAFQGGGGASCAAEMAGLKVSWGFDHDEYAVETALQNFRQARIIECEAADFPPPGFNARCDILHISPPCQAFSMANTNPNPQRDEINTNCLFAVPKIIQATAPKIVTLEEADGLLRKKKHKDWFGTLLRMLNEQGYDVKWAIHNALEYGISQPRKRLALIATAPGIPLPNMPKPTHGKPGSGLDSFVTAREAIGNIPRFATHHDPRPAENNREPWRPDQPYPKTLTTNSDAWHWSGRRRLTLRELAGIQGFPHTYKFTGTKTAIERQIGNAVAPPWFKLVLDECIKVLRKVDEKQSRGGRANARNEDNDDVFMSRAASRTLSPAPPISSQASGSSIDDAIVLDGDESDPIEIN